MAHLVAVLAIRTPALMEVVMVSPVSAMSVGISQVVPLPGLAEVVLGVPVYLPAVPVVPV